MCFIAGTLVSAETVLVAIEDIEVGDLVWAYDEETGEKALKEVVQLFRNETNFWTTVYIEVDGKESSITSTPGHKYYLPNNTENRNPNEQLEHASYEGLSVKWVSAQNLKAGDKVLLSDGNYGIIKRVETKELKTPETTYNFEVADFHTYYVGEQEALVHNTKCFDPVKNATHKVQYKAPGGKLVNAYQQTDGLFYAKDITGHGKSVYKVLEQVGSKHLKLIGDAALDGTIIIGKHSSKVGTLFE